MTLRSLNRDVKVVMELEFIKWFMGLAGAVIAVLFGIVLKNTHDIGKLKGTTEHLVRSSDNAEAKKLLDLLKAGEYMEGSDK